MEIITDEEKTSEDLLKDTNIEEQLKAQQIDEDIISSTDIEEIFEEAEEHLGEDGNVSDILKENNDL